MKNAFYFTSKAFFVLKIFKFFSRRFGHVTKQLDQKDKLISNFMTSHPGQQTILIRILPNILKSKGNQTMKFGKLMEYNMRNIFLDKSNSKCGGENSLRSFSGKLRMNVYLDQQSKVLYSLFLLNTKLRALEIY